MTQCPPAHALRRNVILMRLSGVKYPAFKEFDGGDSI